jgi:putative DNA methylase
MDFCYVWLRRLISDPGPIFEPASTRNAEELTGNQTMDRGYAHFTQGLSKAFRCMSDALKPGSPFTFTYHHNVLSAYSPIVVALLDAGLVCSGSLPCPAEMGGSIHIAGSSSSIIDTVFVCRSTGTVRKSWIVETPEEISDLVKTDIASLRDGDVNVTDVDIRCITFGHLARLAVWRLKAEWADQDTITQKLAIVASTIESMAPTLTLGLTLNQTPTQSPNDKINRIRENVISYGDATDEISF